MYNIKQNTISVCVGPEIKMANEGTLAEARLFSNAPRPDKRTRKINLYNKRGEQDEEVICNYRRNGEQGHSFVFNDYVPDFENRSYKLQFRCEDCGIEVLDKVNDERKQNQDYWKGNLVDDMSEVAARYWKKQTKLPVQYIPRTNSTRALFVTTRSEVRI
jgi:hypothetical protein